MFQKPSNNQEGADRCVCPHYSMELPSDDALMEDGRLSRGWKHRGYETSCGKPAYCANGGTQTLFSSEFCQNSTGLILLVLISQMPNPNLLIYLIHKYC